MNRITLMGRLCNDPELKTTPTGTTVVTFRLAVDRNYQKKGEEKKSDFFNVCAWRGTGDFIRQYFRKGDMILIEGEMTTRQYTDKHGNPATWYEVVVDNAYFTGGAKKDNSNAAPPPGAPTYNAPPPPANQPPASELPGANSDDNDDYPF